MSEIMYNSEGKRVFIVDNDFSKISIKDFNSIDLADGNDSFSEYGDGDWGYTYVLSYDKNKAFFTNVFSSYFKDVEWIKDASELIAKILWGNDITPQLSISAEQYISSDKINHAYVESHGLTGEKRDAILSKFADNENRKVRMAVAEQGCGLDRLINDEDALVREEAQKYLEENNYKDINEWKKDNPDKVYHKDDKGKDREI